MGTTLACILYLGHIKLIKYYIFATRTVVRSRATGWVFKSVIAPCHGYNASAHKISTYTFAVLLF